MLSLEQNTQQWLDFRKNKIGASDSPIIMGVSPWKTPYKLWREKLALDGEQVTSWAMERGKELEELARSSLSNELGIELEAKVIQHQTIPYMISSLDGISKDKKVACEIKCPGQADHEIALSGKVPTKYVPQLQHQLETCELDKMWYYSYDGVNGVKFQVYRDDAYIKLLLQMEKDFYQCMQELIPPALNMRDYVQRTDIPWQEAAKDWLMIKSTLKELERKEKEARETLIHLSHDANSKGFDVSVSKVVRRGSVDYSKVPELQGIDLESYRKPHIESWRIMDL